VSCSLYYSGTILKSSEANLVACLGASFGLIHHVLATTVSCEELIILFLTTPFFSRESFTKHGAVESIR